MDAYPAEAPEPGRYPVDEGPSDTDTQILPAMTTPAPTKTPTPAAPQKPAQHHPLRNYLLRRPLSLRRSSINRSQLRRKLVLGPSLVMLCRPPKKRCVRLFWRVLAWILSPESQQRNPKPVMKMQRRGTRQLLLKHRIMTYRRQTC